MTYYVDGPIKRTQRDIFEFTPSIGEVAGAAFDQAIFENPTTSLKRMGEIDQAEYGEISAPVPGTKGAQVKREPVDSPLLTRDEASARVEESGLDFSVPDTGIREKTLDIILKRKKEELQRQIIMASAPSGSAPASLISGFAASAIDPINVASAFIPVVGEARYTSMLAKAGSGLGRFGVRARVGAIEGAVGTAALEPIMLAASSQDQTDYDMADSLLNIAFGTVLGGGLHGIGGAVSDFRRSRVINEASAPVEIPTLERQTDSAAYKEPTIQEIMEKQIEADKDLIAKSAQQKALDEMLPDIRADLEKAITKRESNVGDLKKELSNISKQLDSLDDTFKARAKEFQKTGLSRKQAEKAAREAIQEERLRLNNRHSEITESLSANREAELAAADLSNIQKGIVPERYREQVNKRSNEITKGFDKKPLSSFVQMSARQIAEAAPSHVRTNALKSAIAQAVTGRDIDVMAHFDSVDNPDKAISHAKSQPRKIDPQAMASSERAAEMIKSVKDDVTELQNQLQNDELLATEVADQLGLKIDFEEADALSNQAETYKKAWNAAAICMMRN